MNIKTFKPQYVLGFIFDSKLEKVLLMKKNRGPIPEMIGKLNGIGGSCELGEDFYYTMERECQEETGLKLNGWTHFCDLDASEGLVHCFYISTNEISNYKQMEDEELGIYNIELNDEFLFRNLFSKPLIIKNNSYKKYPHMASLEWLIPMAINHCNQSDLTNLFEIKEV